MYENDDAKRTVHLADAFDAIQDGIVIMDREAKIIWANAWMKTYYPEHAPFVGRSFPDAFATMTGSSFERPCANAISTGEPQSFVRAYVDPTGAERWLEVRIYRLEGSGDGCTGAVAHFTDVTERRRMEEEREAEAARRRVLVQHSRDGIVVVDRDGAVVEANERYAQQLGYTLDEVYDLHIWDWDLSFPKSELLRMLADVDPSGDHFETVHKRKDGSNLHVEISSNGAEIGGQKFIFCVCRDITERREMEQRLEEEIAWRRGVMRESRDGMVVMNRTGGVVEANEEFARQIGYSLDECQRLHIWEWNPSVPKDVLLRLLADVDVAGEVIETTHTRKDGSTYEVEICSQGSEIAGAKYVLSVCRDVSKRNQLERTLEAEIAWRKILFGESRDGIVVLDEDAAVVEANQEYARQLGYTLEEVRGLHVWDWAADYSPREQLINRIRAMPPGGELFEARHKRKDGSVFHVEINSNGVEIAGKKYALCVCRDVSERKRTEAERERLIEELQEAVAEIRTLRGILPVCSYCNKVRDDDGYWHRVDEYIRDHSEADVSHGICPDCLKKYYGDLALEDD